MATANPKTIHKSAHKGAQNGAHKGAHNVAAVHKHIDRILASGKNYFERLGLDEKTVMGCVYVCMCGWVCVCVSKE